MPNAELKKCLAQGTQKGILKVEVPFQEDNMPEQRAAYTQTKTQVLEEPCSKSKDDWIASQGT